MAKLSTRPKTDKPGRKHDWAPTTATRGETSFRVDPARRIWKRSAKENCSNCLGRAGSGTTSSIESTWPDVVPYAQTYGCNSALAGAIFVFGICGSRRGALEVLRMLQPVPTAR